MTKEAINNNGEKVRVPLDTPVRTKNGIHYLLTPVEQTNFDEAIAEYIAKAPLKAKELKLEELNKYYNNEELRLVTYNNRALKINDKALLGITLLRGRLVDNNEVTSLDWFYDDGGSDNLNLGQIKQLHKFIVSEDSRLRKLKALHSEAIKALTTENEINNYDFKADINGLSWIKQK